MKLCSRHSTDLITTLKHKGLWKFCSTVPAIMHERKQKWIDGMCAPSEIDPLIISILEIDTKAIEMCGNQVAFKKLNGEHKCPLCEVGKLIGHKADLTWIDNVTDAVHSMCLQNGIMKPRGVALQ